MNKQPCKTCQSPSDSKNHGHLNAFYVPCYSYNIYHKHDYIRTDSDIQL